MFPEDLGASWNALALVAVTTPAAYLLLITLSRIAGLRSFSQMTNFDLAATVALGSMLATTAVSPRISLLQGSLGIAALFASQALVARLRRRHGVPETLDNRPLLLMRDGEMVEDNLRRAKVTEDDVRAKLRLAGVTRYERVEAVVMETTGEVSVLSRGSDGKPVDPDLLSTVRGGAGVPVPGTET